MLIGLQSFPHIDLLLCSDICLSVKPVTILLVQTVEWYVIKGNSSAREDVAFFTFTAATDMMTVGTLVMRGGMFCIFLILCSTTLKCHQNLPELRLIVFNLLTRTIVQFFFRCVCAPGEFQCPDDKCVPANRVCDGQRDCPAGTDEEICPSRGKKKW